MNHLYYGDNLDVLRKHVADDSVDLIYLDPPFNSDATYNLVVRDPSGAGSGANIEAFEDTWEWGEAAEAAFQDVRASGHQRAAAMLGAMREALGTSDLMAYLAMMAVRLTELHRVLKPTGSLYLHGEPADLASARQWFRDDSKDKKQWELWALSLLGDAKPWQGTKKGSDGGRDGVIPFGTTQKALVSVKGGGVSVKDVRELLNVVERDKAQVGILLTLEEPTGPMLKEAAGAGTYALDPWPPVPKCQIVAIEEAMALRDRAVRLPARRGDAFKPAPREEPSDRQGSLGL